MVLVSLRVFSQVFLGDVAAINSRTDVSQERLETVEARMSLIYGLMQKFSCRDEAELVAERDRLSELLFDSTQLEEKRTSIREELDMLAGEYERVADALNASRNQASRSFAASICDSIRDMELPYAVFEVHVCDAPMSSTGKDSVQFTFSATGKNPVDVAKCASGGEMSRIMLALKAMMARYAQMPTMIFDEIDTGVSGSVADRMGSVICSMGESMQVFAIQTRNYEDKDGKRVYVTEVVAEEVYFADTKRDANSFEDGFNSSVQPAMPESSGGFMEIEEDPNLPF